MLLLPMIFATQAPAATPDGPGAPVTTLDALTDTLLPRVEALHGLKFKTPPARQTLSPDALRAWLTSRLDEEAESFPPNEEMFRLLGVLPPDRGLRALTEQLMGDQVAGLYDPRDKMLYIVDQPGAQNDGARQLFLAHEIAHALDDQHFDLGAMLELSGDSDMLMARQSVIEGSATVLMTRYVVRGVQSGWIDPKAMMAYAREEAERSSGLASYPAILPTTLVAPYLAGFGFLAWNHGMMDLAGDGAWFTARLREGMADLPTSMEQVLHPERGWGERDHPVRFTEPKLPWNLRYEDTLGELVTAQVLEPTRQIGLTAAGSGIPDGAKMSSRAATGWDGDRFYLLDDGRAVWMSAWDSEKDRKEFVKALRKARPDSAQRLVGGRLVMVGLGLSEAELDTIGTPTTTENNLTWTP